ncbi:unnamed protein product [Paramecium sonneborni]|uniref:Insulin-like growth factor binding protein, N-terminal n=1 Tax=Paramecium sonneborni TaxID=65129 RepID=A0A8S1LL22_9CILI|nr:unnamed protein product [Paramecium sonneborni]
MIKKILIITIFLQTQRSEWLKEHQYAQKDTLMNNMQVKNDICQNTDYMINSYLSNKAYYINCTTPLKNYITLNSNTNQVYNCDYEQCKFYCQYKCLISFDLYYQGIWMNNLLEFQIYKYNYIYYHTSNNYQLNKDFCDDSYYEIQQINITHSQVSILNFTISTNIVGNGQVSLRNIHILNFYYNCYPKCQTCSGPENNQCSSCFYGIQENQICPPCPFNQYYVQYKGCFPKCNFIEPLCLNGFCKLCQSSELFSLNLQNYTEWVFWSVIYDHQIQDTVPQVFWFNQLIYGILKNNSGISRLILEIVPKIGYYVGLSIQLIFFDELPPNCGIHIKFNRTYYGSIFNTSSGIRLHNFTTSNCTKYEYSYQQYQNYQLCEIYGYFDIPQYPFLFTAIGNLTNPQVGWAMMGIQITSDYCTNYCLECDISYKCKICEIPYLLYRDGTCIQECNDLYQKNNGSYCKDFDDETQYSELLIKENIIQTFEYNSQYNLIHQNGNNFLKGQNIHYSFWNGFLIFGGAYVWAQAKFERILQIDRPHHSVSIAFYILYGPEFPSDSQFIITIQQSYQIIKYKSQAINQNDDGTFIDIVSEKRIHQQNVLNITFECKGENNEPIKAFCGLYNFYLAVHYCQPYCRQCIDQQSCQDWNRTDYLTQIQFSQADCQIKQYFDIHTSLCISCPLQCKRCTSKFSCQECENSYRLTNLGCFCAKNQYEELNQCQDCPLKCNQCLSNTFCFECVDIVNMRLVNGLCECIDGYSWDSNINKCHSDCTSNCPQECQNECIQCILGKCYECENEWYVDPIKNICIEKCGDFIQLPNEQCETSFILPYKGCQNCKPRCQSTCSNCSTSGIGCLECIEGYSLIDNLCYSICGDMIITVDEQCDDGNFIYGDGCHFCQYSCQDSCQDCINGICYNYQLQHPLTKMQCDPMIGNELENNSELCNLIGDLYLLSNLYNINFGCDLNCQKCFFKVCQSCNQNYMISTYSKQCTQHTQLFDLVDHCDQQIGNICSKCFDYAYFDIMEQRCKPKSLNINQCQNLMIQVPDQLCNQCFENCIKCSNNDCIKCMEGYYFDDQFQCISYCGDGILTNNEQCEIYDDNCQNCEFQQFQYCLVQFQDTCLQCKYGFHFNFISKICESICRDGQKADDEECEFDNQNIQSGCKYYCSEDCICILEDQQIINAEDLDDTITINNQIFINQNDLNQINNDSDQQNCGNAKFQPSLNEQCDDGNTIGGDGCSETCTNEPFFKCQHFENQQSECSYLEVPDFFLNRLSDEQNSLQIIDLQFSQEIKLNQTNTIENLATYSIEPYTQYKLIVIPLVNLTTELLMPHYQFSIQFQENVDNSKFNIRFKENIIFNSNNIGLKSYNKNDIYE